MSLSTKLYHQEVQFAMLKNKDKKRQAFKNFLHISVWTPGGQYYNEKKENDKCDFKQI